MNLILFGFMGTGKTTVGRAAARALGLRFVDMDAEIERRAQCGIADIFSTRGEDVFRAMERSLVQELAGLDGLVVATGGGFVLDSRNTRDLTSTGVAVCLRADASTILSRVASDTHRPLLEDRCKERAIRDLLARRDPLYAAAGRQVETAGRSPQQVADEVADIYRKAVKN